MSNIVQPNECSKNRLLQITELEILKEFINYCEQEQLQYYLAYGSLLGAKRHNGFIPWDDDVDVAMPRKDYDTFCSKCAAHFSGRYQFRHFRVVADYDSYVPRIEDDTVVVVDLFGYETKAWIDVFPIDGMPPKNTWANRWHKVRLWVTRTCINMARMASGVEFRRENRSYAKRAVLAVLRVFNPGKFMNSRKLYEALDRLLKKYDGDLTGNCVDFMGEQFKDECDISVYGNGRRLLFEDMEMAVPEKTEELLTQIYGDYMEPPPEYARNVHNFCDVRKVK